MNDPLPTLDSERAALRARPKDIAPDALLARLVDLARERRGTNIVSLDMRGLVDWMDHTLIVTGRSRRQNQAIAIHIIRELKREAGLVPLSREGMDPGTWICIDYLDVIVHLFDAETRAHYDIELRWADAKRTEHEASADLGEDEVGYGDDAREEGEEGVIRPQ